MSKEQFIRQMTFRIIIILLMGFLIGLFIQDAEAQYPGDMLLGHKKAGSVYMQIMRNTNGNPPHSPVELAQAIENSAAMYGLSANLLAAIAAVESGYFVGAINSRTADYGIMQVNAHNIKALKLNKKRLLTDIQYSMDSGAKILAWFKKKYAKKELKTWFCRYNWGTRSVKSGVGKRICNNYVQKVRKAM